MRLVISGGGAGADRPGFRVRAAQAGTERSLGDRCQDRRAAKPLLDLDQVAKVFTICLGATIQ
jgi:hypothetical protein